MSLHRRWLPPCCLVIGIAMLSPPPLRADDFPWNTEPEQWEIPAADNSVVVTALALSRDDRQLALGLNTGEFVLLNTENGSLITRRAGHPTRINAIVFLADEKLATGGDDGLIKIWNLAEESDPETLTGHTQWTTSLAVSHDGRWLASGSYDRTVRLWNLQAEANTSIVLEKHTAAVKAVDFSPDGAQLATGSADRTVQLWNLKTKQPIAQFSGHGGAVRDVKFSPDGSQLAMACEDGVARLWDIKTGERIHQLRGHASLIFCLAFSSDGKWLATGGYDQRVSMWDVKSGERSDVLRGPKLP